MRIYIIGNDGITLSREAPAALNEGDIAVASNEELHAAALSGKRLLAPILAEWSERDFEQLGRLLRRFVDDLLDLPERL